MKIFYLHGLESTNNSSKVDLMRSLGHDVHAEYMDYRKVLDLYEKTLNSIKDFKPFMIVGSSMGGYFAYHLGTHYKTNLILLNPALPNRTFDPPILPDGIEKSKIWALLGENDDVVDPVANEEILKRVGAKVQIGDHEHRTPPKVFEPFFKDIIAEL
tara:strand:- start:3430 stop:3900 length:471 start_codon:yes stop_codon:yes gene_type:complete